MTATATAFQVAEQTWDLEKLYSDLAAAKQQYSGKKRRLTALEMACLRGLLCGRNPTEIAGELNREPRGLRVDLCRGLYRYVEVLTAHSPNALKDWRDIADWLKSAGYRNREKPETLRLQDSQIEIVDIGIAGEKTSFVLDIKVRNIGSKVAFVKQATFQFHKVWLLQGWLPPINFELTEELGRVAPASSSLAQKRSRRVKPSYDYELDLGNIIPDPSSDLQPSANARALNLSQCIDYNDVDRFTITLKFSPLSQNRNSNYFDSFLYYLNVDIVCDEDNKTATSQDLFILVEPNFLSHTHQYLAQSEKENNRDNSQFLRESRKRDNLNRQVLLEVARKEGRKSASLVQILHQLHFE